MTPHDWHYHPTDKLWKLYVIDRDAAIYSVASNLKPTVRETAALLRRLERYYPWLRSARERQAA
jgi:hypothetical protein